MSEYEEFEELIRRISANDPTLTEFNLRNKIIGDIGAGKIADALMGNTSIQSLYFVVNNIGDDGAGKIADALKINTSIQTLLLSLNNIGDLGAGKIADALMSNTSIQSLDFGGNNIGDIGAGKIADALKINTSIQSLNLSYNYIGEIGAGKIADALKIKTTIQSLKLSFNNIGDIGAGKIADALKINTSIQSLSFDRNNIGDIGAGKIADALKINTSIQELNLLYNNIGDTGAGKIADALKINTSIQSLNFGGNNIGDIGAGRIADALMGNTSVQSLDLYNNNIGDTGAGKIADSLKGNTSIKSLNFCVNNIGEVGAGKIADSLMGNTSIQSLNGIDLSEYTKILDIPIEFSEKSNEDILKYLIERNTSSAVEVRRMKVIVVGTGGVGKTTLVKRLVTGEFNSHEPMTDGIFMQEWLEPESKIQFSLWDFGGQEIYLNTHRLFFSDRTLFVVMWDAQAGNEETTITYLRAIHSFYPEAPVLLVSSHALNATCDGDSIISRLQSYHANIVAYYPIDSSNGTGFAEFIEALAEYSLQQDHVCQSLPRSYVKLEEKVKLARSEQFSVSVNEFQTFVLSVGLDADHFELALDLFHAWGVVHCLPGENSDIVLNPQDLADIFRCVITASTNRPGQSVYKDGILPHEHLNDIWGSAEKKYEEYLWLQFLELLYKCNLAFPLFDSDGVSLEKSLVPAMLSSITIPTNSAEIENVIVNSCIRSLSLELPVKSQNLFSIYIRFDFLPSHFFPRLVVALRSMTTVGGTWANCCILYVEQDLSQGTSDRIVLVFEDMKQHVLRIIPIIDPDGLVCSLVTTAIASLLTQHFKGSTIKKVKLTQDDDDLLNEAQLREKLNSKPDDKEYKVGAQTIKLSCLISLLNGFESEYLASPLIDNSKSKLFQGELEEILHLVVKFQHDNSKDLVRLKLQQSVLKHLSKLNFALHGVSRGLNTLWLPLWEENGLSLVALSVNRKPTKSWIRVNEAKISKVFSITTELPPSEHCNEFDLNVLKDIFRILCYPQLDIQDVPDVVALPVDDISNEFKKYQLEMIDSEAIHFSEPEESSVFNTEKLIFADILNKGTKDAETAIVRSLNEIKRKQDSYGQFTRLQLENPLGIPRIFILIPMKGDDQNSSMYGQLEGAARYIQNQYKLFFVCPISGEICKTNEGKGYDLHLPTEWFQQYGPGIKFALSLCIVLAALGKLFLGISNPIEPVKDEISNALESGFFNPTELQRFLDQLNALTSTSSSNSIDFKVARDEAYRLLSIEVMKIDPSLSRCGCKWVVSNGVGENSYAMWVSPEMEDKFKREGKAAIIPEIRNELF